MLSPASQSLEPTPVIHTFVLGEFQTNCFVVTTPGSNKAWIVDCGYSPAPLLQFLRDNNLEVEAILLTHCHADHIAGLDDAINVIGHVPIYVHDAERDWCANPILNLSAWYGLPVSVTSPDRFLLGGESLELNGSRWRVVHTPGHSPGGVCYVNDASKQAIVGDAIFAGSIGRMDFPTSNPRDLRRSVLQTIMSLPDDMTIHPGHGPATTIGRERRTNPYVVNGF
jgi:glyoxylase-like metal-dependent hydrolase (beta-lactamase superfamily II)